MKWNEEYEPYPPRNRDRDGYRDRDRDRDMGRDSRNRDSYDRDYNNRSFHDRNDHSNGYRGGGGFGFGERGRGRGRGRGGGQGRGRGQSRGGMTDVSKLRYNEDTSPSLINKLQQLNLNDQKGCIRLKTYVFQKVWLFFLFVFVFVCLFCLLVLFLTQNEWKFFYSQFNVFKKTQKKNQKQF